MPRSSPADTASLGSPAAPGSWATASCMHTGQSADSWPRESEVAATTLHSGLARMLHPIKALQAQLQQSTQCPGILAGPAHFSLQKRASAPSAIGSQPQLGHGQDQQLSEVLAGGHAGRRSCDAPPTASLAEGGDDRPFQLMPHSYWSAEHLSMPWQLADALAGGPGQEAAWAPRCPLSASSKDSHAN